MVEPFRFGPRDRAPEDARRKVDVGVGEEDEVARRALDTALKRVHLAEPSVGQLADVNRGDPGVSPRDGR